MCKHWGLHISTNINYIGAVLGSFWVVWKGLFWCLKAKLRSWWFLRYWWFNKWYHSGYLLICLISRLSLIASRHDWHWLKGLFKGFQKPLRLYESSKNWWRYSWIKFVTLLSLYKRTPYIWLWSTPCCLPTWFHCIDSGYQRMEKLEHKDTIRGYSEATQNTLDISRRGILSKSNV